MRQQFFFFTWCSKTSKTYYYCMDNYRKQPQSGVLKDNCFESDHVKFLVKSLEKYWYRTSFLVKFQAVAHRLLVSNFTKNELFWEFFKDLNLNLIVNFRTLILQNRFPWLLLNYIDLLNLFICRCSFSLKQIFWQGGSNKPYFVNTPGVKDIFNREIFTILQSKFPNVAVHLTCSYNPQTCKFKE